MLRLGPAAHLEMDGYMCVFHAIRLTESVNASCTARLFRPAPHASQKLPPACTNPRLPADPTILIDTTSLYGAKHPGVTVVPSSGGRKASCDAETCCEGSALGTSQRFPLDYMQTTFFSGCLLGATCQSAHLPLCSARCLLAPSCPTSQPRSCSRTAWATTPAAGRSKACCCKPT